MARNDGTGPVGQGSQDGRGRVNGGRGQSSRKTGSGKKTGGKKGDC